MRVLFVTRPIRGGMRTFVMKALAVLRDEGVEAGLAGPDPMAPEGVPTWPVAVGSGGRGAQRGLSEAVRAFGPDLLHVHGLRAGLLVRRGSDPYVYTLHGFPAPGPRGALHRALDGRVMGGARAVSAVSPALQAYARPLERRPVSLLPPPVEVPPAAPPLPDGPPVFGYLGRLAPEKGVDVLIRAFAEIRLDKSRLLLAGDGPEGDGLARLAARLGVGERVSFLGWVDDPSAFFAGIHIYVQPSRREGLGLSVLEAAAHGRSVVASATGGLAGTLQPEWAAGVAPGEAAPLARALARAVAGDLRGRGAAAHAWASAHMGGPALGRALAALYRTALSQREEA